MDTDRHAFFTLAQYYIVVIIFVIFWFWKLLFGLTSITKDRIVSLLSLDVKAMEKKQKRVPRIVQFTLVVPDSFPNNNISSVYNKKLNFF